MKVAILDTRSGGQPTQELDPYRTRGYDLITHWDLYKPDVHYDIISSLWTRLGPNVLARVAPKAVIIQDADEPYNIVDEQTVKAMGIMVCPTAIWGLNTRVLWHLPLLESYSPGNNVAICAESVIHDALADRLRAMDYFVRYPLTAQMWHHKLTEDMAWADTVVIHQGKGDFPHYWADSLFPHMKDNALFISTTRGPLYSAKGLHKALDRGIVAVLDWAWQQKELGKHPNLHITNSSSYKSDESRHELTEVTLAEIDRAFERIPQQAAQG